MEDIVDMVVHNYTEKLWSAAMGLKSSYSYKKKKKPLVLSLSCP